MQALIDEYKEYREALKKIQAADQLEQALINGMGRDMDYAIEWMETGRRPGSKRGVERLAAYQREIPTDIIEKYMKPPPSLEVGAYDVKEYAHMEFILAMLTDRERECYEMKIGGMMTDVEIANTLGLARRTVREFIARAERKVKNYVKKPVPMSLDLVV